MENRRCVFAEGNLSVSHAHAHDIDPNRVMWPGLMKMKSSKRQCTWFSVFSTISSLSQHNGFFAKMKKLCFSETHTASFFCFDQIFVFLFIINIHSEFVAKNCVSVKHVPVQSNTVKQWNTVFNKKFTVLPGLGHGHGLGVGPSFGFNNNRFTITLTVKAQNENWYKVQVCSVG